MDGYRIQQVWYDEVADSPALRLPSAELLQWSRFQRVITCESLIVGNPRGPILVRFARFRADTAPYLPWAR